LLQTLNLSCGHALVDFLLVNKWPAIGHYYPLISQWSFSLSISWRYDLSHKHCAQPSLLRCSDDISFISTRCQLPSKPRTRCSKSIQTNAWIVTLSAPRLLSFLLRITSDYKHFYFFNACQCIIPTLVWFFFPVLQPSVDHHPNRLWAIIVTICWPS